MKSNFVVEIGDENGKSCKFAITTDGKTGIGSWRTIDKGFIKENSGWTQHFSANGTLGWHLQLAGGENKYGIQLNDWTYWMGFTNDQGTGWLSGGWAVGLRMGRISWIILG